VDAADRRTRLVAADNGPGRVSRFRDGRDPFNHREATSSIRLRRDATADHRSSAPRETLAVSTPVDSRLDDVEKIDQQILRLLAGDGRMSYTDLGKATGLSTSAVHQRVKRLEERGLITGYGASIDHAKAGRPLTAFISITPIDAAAADDYPERLAAIGEIESCWSVAGDESYILKVRVAVPADLEELLARIRAAANVSTRTTIVLSTPYENRPIG
jgi:Lrp/AsnC family leucine-responsive transcriptional regulator